MIRTFLEILYTITYLIVTLPVMGIIILISKKNPDAASRIATPMIRFAFLCLRGIAGIDATVIGTENIPKEGACLFVGNHRSIFDIILVYPYISKNRLTGIVSKDALGKVPIFSLWCKHIGCIFLDRSNPKDGMKIIMRGTEKLKQGKSLLLYPEGSRKKEPEDLPLMEFHEGSFRMAIKSGATIVPCCYNNMISIYEKQYPRVKKTKVVLEFLEPIHPGDFTREEQRHLGAHVRELMQATVAKNAELLK